MLNIIDIFVNGLWSFDLITQATTVFLLVWIKMGWHLVIDAKQFNTISTILNLIFIFILIDNEKIMVVTVAVTAVMSAWASSNGTTWEQYTRCVRSTLCIYIILYFCTACTIWTIHAVYALCIFITVYYCTLQSIVH